MYCSNCGAKIPNKSKFCPKCGTKQIPLTENEFSDNDSDQEWRKYFTVPGQEKKEGFEESQQADSENERGTSGSGFQANPAEERTDTYETQEKEQVLHPTVTNNSGLDVLITIVAMAGAVIFVCSVFYNIFNIFDSFSMLGYFAGNLLGFFINELGLVLILVGNIVMVFGLVTIGLRRKKETTISLFAVVCLAGALDIVLHLLSGILRSLFSILFYGYSFFEFRSLVPGIICPILTVTVLFLVLYLAGMNPLIGQDKDQNKAIFASAMETFGDAWKSNTDNSAKSKGSTTGYGADTGENPDFTYINKEARPAFHVKTDRSIWMYILLTIITCGIYGYYFIYSIARDTNQICEGDNEKTGGLLIFILLSIITCGIYEWYWLYKLGNRLAANGPRYGIYFQENGTSVLLWCIFGMLICGIGPLIAINILIKNTNRLAQAYNEYHHL